MTIQVPRRLSDPTIRERVRVEVTEKRPLIFPASEEWGIALWGEDWGVPKSEMNMKRWIEMVQKNGRYR